MSDVPCAGCTACCRFQLILLMPEDEPNLPAYSYIEHTKDGETLRALKGKPNGDCAHLGPSGCGVYDRRPAVCRAYDCRRQFVSMSRNERRKQGAKAIWREARKRLDSLER